MDNHEVGFVSKWLEKCKLQHQHTLLLLWFLSYLIPSTMLQSSSLASLRHSWFFMRRWTHIHHIYFSFYSPSLFLIFSHELKICDEQTHINTHQMIVCVLFQNQEWTHLKIAPINPYLMLKHKHIHTNISRDHLISM